MLQNDSRKIKPGDTFIALKGIKHNGEEFISEAINKGASKIIVSKDKFEVVKDTNKYLIEYIKNNYQEKIKKLKIIGITGTNGKTTTAYLLYQALNKCDIKSAYIGTIGFYMDGYYESLNNTTPDILKLYQLFMKCISNNIEYVIMEVSSQALSYHRLDTILFDGAIFTNLTQDHLDYHKTMDNYLKAKQKLFKKLKNNSFNIINIDDNYGKYFKNNNSITFGKKDSNYIISNINISINGSSFSLNKEEYKTKLIGIHNIYNLSIIIIVLKILNIEYLKIKDIIKNMDNVIGRMDSIKYKDNLIIIDYAHTPDAVEKIIKSVKNLCNKVITIVGCGGNRDKTKRPIMGDVATSLSDEVIFTSDNPRNENPNEIIKDIVNKLDKNNYEIEVNRKKAIEKGIQKLKNNDILLILGKGHEDYQIINDNKIHFSDKEEVIKIIGE